MRLALLFVVASLTLVGAMLVIASPNPVEAVHKKLFCYQQPFFDNDGLLIGFNDLCFKKHKDCEAAFLADPYQYQPCRREG